MAIVIHKTVKNEPVQQEILPDAESEEYKTRIELLSEIAEEASSITEVSKLLERILKVTRHTLLASKTSIFLNDKENGGLQSSITVRESERAEVNEGITPKELEIATWVGIHITPLLIGDLSRDIRFGQNIDEYTDGMTHSVAAVPIMRGKNVIGVLEAVNRGDSDELCEGDLHLLKTFASTEALVLLVSMALIANSNINCIALDHALLDGYLSTAEAWASTADIKDSYAYAHSRRVREYALMAANRLSLSTQELQAIEFGALLHDIGKIGIDSDILCKPGPLTEEEWKIMHEHSVIGGCVLGEIPFLKEAKNIVLYHHERYDGKGYPERLKGNRIPLGARLVAVADAFDTMTTDHSYRNALNVGQALEALTEGIGTQFCPVAVEAFVSAFKKHDGNLPLEKVYSEIKTVVKPPIEPAPIADPLPQRKPTPVINKDVVQGDIRLLVDIIFSIKELRHFREQLSKIEGVKIVMVGSSEEEGHSIVLSVPQALPLMELIGNIPCVGAVEKKGKDILITLKTT
jgi:putative nucleotidyltransferase with HDIG domain